MSASPAGSTVVNKKPPPPLYVEYSSAPARVRDMDCTTEARLLESLFLLTDDARDIHVQQLLDALSLKSVYSVVRFMNLRMHLYDSTSQEQQGQQQGQLETAAQKKSSRRRLPWISLRGQYIRSITRITALGRTSIKLQHYFLTVPNSQINRDFNNRAEDAKYQQLAPGDMPERPIASSEGALVFILWQEDDKGHRFFKPHPGPFQDKTLVLPPFVKMLVQQSPDRSDAISSPRPKNAFRQELLLRKSDEDELGHVTNSRYVSLIYEVLSYGLSQGYYANGSGSSTTSSALPTYVPGESASGSTSDLTSVAVPAGSRFYKDGNVVEVYIGYENELKVKPDVFVWSWVEKDRIQDQLDVIRFEICSGDICQGSEKILSLCRAVVQERQLPSQQASL
ncbi:hypothetical protein BGX34_005191 [Mortierella sp. NVP85]|nr:hypothetical protein BGX34_005191 [Mortierella sp. NVP85]